MATRMRWITFDCFGTLVDWQAGFAGAVRPIFGERTDDVLRAYHAHEAIVEQLKPHRSYKEVLVTALARAAQECGVAMPSTETARPLAEAWASMPVFDDVEPMLAELRRDGWRLAVLTNCDEDLFGLTHQRFQSPFDLVLTAERVRGYKPAPWHFRAFELITRVPKRDWVHVSSSVFHDIAPAQAFGVRSVWLDRARSSDNAATGAVRVHDAAEIVGAIEYLFEQPADWSAARAEAQLC